MNALFLLQNAKESSNRIFHQKNPSINVNFVFLLYFYLLRSDVITLWINDFHMLQRVGHGFSECFQILTSQLGLLFRFNFRQAFTLCLLESSFIRAIFLLIT